MMQQAPKPPKKRAAPSPAEDIFNRGRRGAEDYVRKSRVCGGQMVNASYSSPVKFVPSLGCTDGLYVLSDHTIRYSCLASLVQVNAGESLLLAPPINVMCLQVRSNVLNGLYSQCKHYSTSIRI